MIIIAPSVLSMDFSDTKKALEELNMSKAEWIHYDVMDGHFVPNLTFGPDILKAIRRSTDKFLDVHLMIEDPKYYAPIFIKAGADSITFHIELFNDESELINVINMIKDLGCKVGLSIKPKTDINTLKPYLKYLDLVLVMSVEPGFGGQAFDENALVKIETLRKWIDEDKLDCLISVDGGINKETGNRCKEVGVNVLVAGSYIFSKDIKEQVESLC